MTRNALTIAAALAVLTVSVELARDIDRYFAESSRRRDFS